MRKWLPNTHKMFKVLIFKTIATQYTVIFYIESLCINLLYRRPLNVLCEYQIYGLVVNDINGYVVTVYMQTFV